MRLLVQEVRALGRITCRKVFGEKNPADLLTKHLAAEFIHRHCDPQNMRSVEGRAKTAPTLDSVESYIQSWIEDCEYVDEDGQEETEGIDEIQEDQKSKGRRVHFADLVAVKPIPATGKGRSTPPRGRSTGCARWQSGETAKTDAVDRQSDGASLAHECVCGGLMVKGDGKLWAEVDDDVQCLACAGQWRHQV